MASIRGPRRADGTGWAVLYQYNHQQTSTTFDTEPDAEKFRDAVNAIGAEKAMKAWGITPTQRAAKKSAGVTVAEWVRKYIDSRSGITKATRYDYDAYLRNNIAPSIGDIPLELLSRDDVSSWVEEMFEENSEGKRPAGKTLANRHGLLSASLNAAVRAGLIPVNPALGTRIPRTEREEMTILTHKEFDILLEGFTEYWRPLVRFMVLSGARFGEIAALRPSDVNVDAGTVHIGRAFKRTYQKGAAYELGPTKTKRSVRTIDIAKTDLQKLDYSHDWLFVNTKGGPLQGVSWRTNVWYPSLERARKKGLKKKIRIHDMRHTCASWMIANGESLMVVQRHLGHESISTTVNLYGHLDRRDAQAAAERLGKAIESPQDT